MDVGGDAVGRLSGILWGAREFTPFLRAEQNCTSAIDPLWVFAFGEVNRCMWPLGEEKDL